MRRADRLFQLVQLLRSRRFATSEQLAAELGVSRRTVYRDIRDLERSGVPIKGEAGVGYQLHRGYELPPLQFNAEEIEAPVLGARMVATWGDEELAGASRQAMTKIEAVLPPALREVLFSTALFVPDRPWTAVATSGLIGLRKAFAEHAKVRFEYTARAGEASSRTVWPLGLYFWGSTWSLVAWCELREDYRNFRPDRMASIELLEAFDASSTISLDAFASRMRERGEA